LYLPGRNVLLVSLAAISFIQRGISTFALGVLRSNSFGDSTPRFFSNLTSCLSQSLGVKVKIITPLSRLSKVDVIKSAREVALGLTFSCINPVRGNHCGRCYKCTERRKSFTKASVVDPTKYERVKV